MMKKKKYNLYEEVFSTPPQKKYQEVRKLLKPNPPEHTLLGLYPYERVKFTPTGIRYDDQYCTWYYIKHISARLGKKTKGKHWEYDWKGPNAQFWCSDKLYSPEDDCTKSTPDTGDEEETTLESSLGINYTVNEWLDKTPIHLDDLMVQINEQIEEGEDNFTNQPWWLEPLKTPLKRHYEEFNNFKDTYLCNSVWWEVPNPVQFV
ncbi:12777_t:CDS:2 [Dentiscutata erythropus]|uniref:12777_t:CDS:1 n=1 Tax=Dentiscutata erythropus TaxID=1348616 RepID=A0A9N8W4V1_9GLOM|nr:12777_t:CDS:2 [Dentiscutata erythropus]